jgi:hypothetical protein
MNSICSIIGTVLLALFGVGMLALSYAAVSWTWSDYWLGWFELSSYVIGLICLCVGIAETSIHFGEIRNLRRRR